MKLREKDNSLVNLRALAIMLVVFGHSIILYSSSWGLYHSSQSAMALSKIKDVINVVQMPLFISIAGYSLLFSLATLSDVTKFIRKKISRILVPFLTIGLCWMLPIRLFLHYPGYEGQTLPYILIHDFLLGYDNGHLWFLPTLFLIFCIVGILLYIFGSNNIPKFTGILFLISFLLIAIQYSDIDIFPYFKNVTIYFPFFVEGFIIHVYKEKIVKIKSKNYIYCICAIMLLLCISYVVSGKHIWIIDFVLPFIFVFLCYILIPNFSNVWVGKISQDSMGLYLLHSPLIYFSFTYFPNISPIAMIIINFLGFGTLSLILTELIRRSGLRRVIGE